MVIGLTRYPIRSRTEYDSALIGKRKTNGVGFRAGHEFEITSAGSRSGGRWRLRRRQRASKEQKPCRVRQYERDLSSPEAAQRQPMAIPHAGSPEIGEELAREASAPILRHSTALSG